MEGKAERWFQIGDGREEDPFEEGTTGRGQLGPGGSAGGGRQGSPAGWTRAQLCSQGEAGWVWGVTAGVGVPGAGWEPHMDRSCPERICR